MKAGRLHESVAFDLPQNASDGQGGVEEGWSEGHACRANFRYLRGGETVLKARLEGTQPVVVHIRSCAAARLIETDWRMRDLRRGDIYNIRSIVPSDSRQHLELTVELGVAI